MDSNNFQQTNNRSINTIKLLLVTSIALMVLFVIGISYVSAKSRARDQVRAQDIALIQKFLAAHKLNDGVYPVSVDGKPIDWQKYLQSLPEPPAADGTCSKDSNKYIYKSINNGQGYGLSFCLGSNTDNYQAGVNTLTLKN